MEKQWVVEINKELERLLDPSQEEFRWNRRSINRIPKSVTYINRHAYEPSIISFGPYHHGTEHLKPMEEHKRRALLRFFKRSRMPLQSFLDALTPDVEDLRGAYEQLDGKWQDDDTFLEMMIMDGCFILEMLRATGPVANDYAINDPIFNHGKQYIIPILRRDMLKLENQLPIVVLVKLVSIQEDYFEGKLRDTFVYEYFRDRDGAMQDHEVLITRILKFFQQGVSDKNLHQFDKCLHVLEVYRKSLLLVQPKPTETVAVLLRRTGQEIIRSATELNEAGIRIERNRSRSLTAISFRSGVLKLPRVVVDDALETFYLNLIAFERFHAGSEVTSYISFMDSILRSARDVRLLQTCGVIRNELGSDEAVVGLFQSLSKDITLDPFSDLGCVLWSVNDYCERPWNRMRARIVHTYFTNPWAFISFIGSIFLFALTIIQTVYSVIH